MLSHAAQEMESFLVNLDLRRITNKIELNRGCFLVNFTKF